MTGTRWQFGIDVGGTFTDCVAVAPDGRTHVVKVLSSGVSKGELIAAVEAQTWRTSLLAPVPDFYRGQQWTAHDQHGGVLATGRVTSSRVDGVLGFDSVVPMLVGTRIELSAGEEAPVLAIRTALGLRCDEAIPPVSVRLGTTRGTNALLTRRGALTGFLTTCGFRDVLLIANQDRPRLFDLEIQKPIPLFAAVEEVDERLAADGSVLRAPQAAQVEAALLRLRDAGCESLAICLLHAFANPAHEEFVAAIAERIGFRRISVSNRLSPLIKLVSRGDTTVMDAYLNPILQDYVASLQTQLPGSELRFMTSAGGLVSAARFTGKECVLSGPAGGVIGLARATERAGFPRCIGFDMGGTSTDVARYDGRYEFEFETMKAGVRIVTPMLSIETVAAGGGSLCGFDGVKLFVGPQSAGAVPGPACYGRGGPLTVTDCNVFLGRIPVDRFPFPLDVAAIGQRLEILCTELASAAFGKAYTPLELASGFLEIANAAMARAIRKVSVTKGYDPTEYVLMPFGGAGGQHACAVARLLGMRQILVHPLAGVLSAVGIGHADVRRSGSVTVLESWTAATWERCQPQVQQLIATATAELQEEGVSPARIQPATLTLDLRYQGVDSPLSITAPADGNWGAAYAAKHRQLYGYDRPGRPLELVAIRIEVVGQATSPVTRERDKSTQNGRLLAGVVQNGAAYPVVLRETLQPGDRLEGPVIVAEPTSTLVVDSGFKARVLGEGEILIEDLEDREDASGVGVGREEVGDPVCRSVVDPVQLELFHHTFGSIAEQMGLTLQQTSVSTNVKERLDFSCAIFDPRGGLVVNAPHIPVHLGAMSETVRCILRDNPDLAPGDVFVTNDPYRGGSHLPDVTVVTPVHEPVTGQLLFFTASRAHHAEIGGIVPGSMPPFSKNLGEEGVLIRNFRLQSATASFEGELETLLQSGAYPSRAVADNLADVRAQVAANRSGARLLEDLVAKRGAATVLAYMQHLQDAAAEAMRLALATLQQGTLRFVDHLDDGSPIAAAVTVDGATATIDFTGTGPVLATNLNANRAIVTAAVMYVLRCLIGRAAGASPAANLPLNGGVLEPIRIILPECLLNPPEHADPTQCPAMVGGNVETSQRVVDVLLGAFGLAAASQGTMNNLTFGDATFGYYETICGGSGATVLQQGTDAVHTHMTNTRLTDPEVIERRYPVRLHEFSIRHGSGGVGQHPGGAGIIRRIEFLRPLRVSLLTERRGEFAPYGLNGGEPGQRGRNTLTAADGTVTNLGGKASRMVAAGDTLTIETPGGGGYGTP